MSKGVIHELHENPKAILVVKCLIAAHNGLTFAQLHNANLGFDSFAFGSRFWLQEFECKLFAIFEPLAQEDASKAARALLANHFVVVARGVSSNVRRSFNQFRDFFTIFQILLWLIDLPQDGAETGQRIVQLFFIAEGFHLEGKCFGEVNPVYFSAFLFLNTNPNALRWVRFVLEDHIAGKFTLNSRKFGKSVQISVYYATHRISILGSVVGWGRSLFVCVDRFRVIIFFVVIFQELLEALLLTLLHFFSLFVFCVNDSPDGVPANNLRSPLVDSDRGNFLHAAA